MATKAEKSNQTRSTVIEEARKIFARDGYAKASLSEIVRNAKVTTGAIYHHYGDKKGLFTAVAEHLEQEILAIIADRISTISSDWERLEKGVYYTLDVCSRPDIQRIVFQDAPTVVGLHEWREIEMKYSFGIMMQNIQSLSEQGKISGGSPELVAQILLGTIIEAAHAVALAEDKELALNQARETVLTMLRAIKVS
ncbi:MAG: TetR/AcrR family transcriptional regulator [Methyloligellaceae bacterium]